MIIGIVLTTKGMRVMGNYFLEGASFKETCPRGSRFCDQNTTDSGRCGGPICSTNLHIGKMDILYSHPKDAFIDLHPFLENILFWAGTQFQ